MANSEHVVKLRQNVSAWNIWRKSNPAIEIDLSQADLYAASLNGAHLNGANLIGAQLINATLEKADLNAAKLTGALLRGTDLGGADLRAATLDGANLTGAKLHGANMEGASLAETILNGASLSGVDLRRATLSKANLRWADLSWANLTEANLCEANLTSASLQQARLDRATATGIRLWETQRGRWSIKGIICERAFWDEMGTKPDHYATGEFERLYSDTTRFELLYPGGISTFELNTLPALLHHLTSKFPHSGIRLKSMEETGGGAKICISVDETNHATVHDIRTEATRSQSAQLALRDDEITRLKIQKQLLLEEVFPRMLAAAPQLHFAGDATNVAIAMGGSTVTAHQTSNDTKALLALLAQIKTHTAELPRPQQTQLEDATQSIEHELSKPEPKRSVIASGLEVIKEVAMKVVASGAEKAIEDHWHPWLSQLTVLMHHWTP